MFNVQFDYDDENVPCIVLHLLDWPLDKRNNFEIVNLTKVNKIKQQ